MYNNSRFDGNRRNNSGATRGGFGGRQYGGRPSFGGGGRKMKFFDPTNVIQKSTVTEIKEEIFVAKNSFENLSINNQLKVNILSHGYKAPTPIQDEAIPAGLEGKDIIGMARTGSGKTAAFLIPLIDKVMKDNHQSVIIIAPTRELAVQTQEELRKFTVNMNIFSVLCIGGANMGKQIYGIRKNPHFIIGTPGRLLDLSNQHVLNLKNYNNVVLDEVDRILDMGFIEDLKKILDRLPEPRQSFFFSATMPPKVDAVARTFLRNPILISVNSNAPTESVKQELVKLNGKGKVEVLHQLLIKEGFDKVLVFGRTKHGIEKLSDELKVRGFKIEAIHGNKSQNQRTKALENFKKGFVKVLLATDIVARGMDINNVTHVINYELPESYEDYIHRIGRTGRADKKGIAITLIN
jgi:superfamily II DNA/RNA helicase